MMNKYKTAKDVPPHLPKDMKSLPKSGDMKRTNFEIKGNNIKLPTPPANRMVNTVMDGQIPGKNMQPANLNRVKNHLRSAKGSE